MNKRCLFSCALLTSSFLSFPLSAECISSPDCADLGYDKTSCPSGDGVLKCPFDISKLKCMPLTCESIGKKTCGENCVPSTFAGCCSDADCTSGKICDNNVCKEVICAVGDIYYSDKTCSTNLISGKTPIGVVGKISNGGRNGIVVEKNHSSSSMQWGCYGTDLSCITNMPGSDGGSNPELRADYNGKSNTACMVSNGCTSGTYCNSRSVEGVTGWYLPAGGELYDTMIGNRTTVNTGLGKISGATKIPSTGASVYYWSSSEYSGSPAYYAWYWYFYDGRWYYNLKSNANGNYARCVLAF